MKEGILIYDENVNRLDILFSTGNSLGGLHCGDRLEVLQYEEWVPTRVEYDDGWYLYGLYQRENIPADLKVRA